MNILVETVDYAVKCEASKHSPNHKNLADYKVSGLGDIIVQGEADVMHGTPKCNRVYHCCSRHLPYFVSAVCRDDVSMELKGLLA